jgi:hypothetical protein
MRPAWLGAALVYGALALLTQRSLLPHLTDGVYQQAALGNDCLLHIWTLGWDHHALATQPLALSDANIFFPYRGTLLYSDHLLGLAVLLVPLRLVTDNLVLIHNLVTVAAPALDALALYALTHALTGQPVAAFVGGLVYGFPPLRLYLDACQVQMLVAWWPPLVLLLARRGLLRNTIGPGVLAGVALALQGLTGIYLTAFFLPFLGLAHLVWLRQFPLRAHARGWAGLLVGEAVAALAVLPSALAYRAVQAELGVSRSVVLNTVLSLQPSELTRLLPVLTVGTLLALGVVWPRARTDRTERGFYAVMTLGAFLFALGPALTLPGDLGRVRGPYAALLALPGFDALRVPGRMIHMALLGGSVLAASGFAAATARLPPLAAAAAAGAVLAARLAEAWPPALPTLPTPPPGERDPVYSWLAAQPEGFTFIELPVDDFAIGAAHYQYASTAHWKKMATGNMGIMPPVYPWLVHKLQRFPDPDVVATLRQLGVGHAVAHQQLRGRDRLLQALATGGAPLEMRYERGRTRVVALREDTPTPPHVRRGSPLDRARWRLTATHGAADAPRAADGDLATSWSTWREIEQELSRWYDPMPFSDRWARFLAEQPIRLEVDLGEVAAVTAIDMAIAGTDPLAVPGLVIEASLDGAAWTRIPGELDPVPDARALVYQPAAPRYALVPPAPVPARKLRVSCNGLELRVGELEVYGER